MWVYRRILKIPWMAKISNEEVLRRVNRDRELFNIIKKRKTAYLGHIMRNSKYQLLQLIIEGKIEGKRGRGRKTMDGSSQRSGTPAHRVGQRGDAECSGVHPLVDRQAKKKGGAVI